MTYSDYLDDLAERIDLLSPRAKAAVFWLLGSSLLAQIDEPADWTNWFASAKEVGYRYISTGELADDIEPLWAQAGRHTETEPSQLVNSTVICLSTALGIVLDPSRAVGAWAEHAFFPLVEYVSSQLFDDVVSQAMTKISTRSSTQPNFRLRPYSSFEVVTRLAGTMAPDVRTLDALAEGINMIAPSHA
jgi:hypothetical protein